jgi:hypothetical protein
MPSEALVLATRTRILTNEETALCGQVQVKLQAEQQLASYAIHDLREARPPIVHEQFQIAHPIK